MSGNRKIYHKIAPSRHSSPGYAMRTNFPTVRGGEEGAAGLINKRLEITAQLPRVNITKTGRGRKLILTQTSGAPAGDFLRTG